MDLNPGDSALAVRAGPLWGLLAGEAPEQGKFAVSVRAGAAAAAFRAYRPKEGEYALVLRAASGHPAVVRLVDDEEDEEPVGPPRPPDDCLGVNPLCSRIQCHHWLRNAYRLSFSHWFLEAESLNGVCTVDATGDCRWTGRLGSWNVELLYPWSTPNVKWLCSVEHAENPDRFAVLGSQGRPYHFEPEGDEFLVLNAATDVGYAVDLPMLVVSV